MKKGSQRDLLLEVFVDQLLYFAAGRTQRDKAGEHMDRFSFEHRDPKPNVHVNDDESKFTRGEQFDQSDMLGELPSRFFQQFQVAAVINVPEGIGVIRSNFERCFVDHNRNEAELV